MDAINLLYSMRNNKNNIPKEFIKFYGSCMENVHETNSQCFQDIWVLYENRFKKGGFFVDFGATDGIAINNSYVLEKKYGWDGILSEPNSIYHKDIFNNRNCKISTNCVFSESDKEVYFIETSNSELSTIKGFGKSDEHSRLRENGDVKVVRTISLLDLLKTNNAPKMIDYLSIDTEGSEFAILNAFFNINQEYKIKCITVEHNNVKDYRQNLYTLLIKNGYVRKFTEISLWDDFYILEK